MYIEEAVQSYVGGLDSSSGPYLLERISHYSISPCLDQNEARERLNSAKERLQSTVDIIFYCDIFEHPIMLKFYALHELHKALSKLL